MFFRIRMTPTCSFYEQPQILELNFRLFKLLVSEHWDAWKQMTKRNVGFTRDRPMALHCPESRDRDRLPGPLRPPPARRWRHRVGSFPPNNAWNAS